MQRSKEEMLNIKVITPPAVEPISLAEAKLHLRVDTTADDTLITALIIAARNYVEGFQNRALITQTLELSLDRFPRTNDRFDAFNLPRPPFQSLVSFSFTDEEGDATTLEEGVDFILDADSFFGRISRKRGVPWPTDILKEIGSIKIRYIAGFGNAAAVPQNIKQAMFLLLGHFYEHREATAFSANHKLNFAVDSLLSQDRIVPI